MLRINKNYIKLKKNYLFREINEKVEYFKKKNKVNDIISLGIGDVSMPLANEIVEKMSTSIFEQTKKQSFKGYPPEEGYLFLREAIRKYYAKRKVEISNNEIFISNGAGCDVANLTDIFSKSDILIQNPTYPAYYDANFLSGNKIEFVLTTEENDFVPISPKKKKQYIIYLCSPNNPTGQTMNKLQLQKWIDYANETKSIIIFDVAYEKFIEGDYPHSIYELKGAKTCAIEVASFSKSAGFTNLRVSYSIVPFELERENIKINDLWKRRQSTYFNGVPYHLQKGAEFTLGDIGQNLCDKNIDVYKQNSKKLCRVLQEKGLKIYGNKCSPYIWFKCPNQMSSWEYFDFLLENYHIVGIPGDGFGECGKNYFRFSCLGTKEDIDDAILRLNKL